MVQGPLVAAAAAVATKIGSPLTTLHQIQSTTTCEGVDLLFQIPPQLLNRMPNEAGICRWRRLNLFKSTWEWSVFYMPPWPNFSSLIGLFIFTFQLYVHLNADELKCFAILLKRWTSENLPFPEFLQKVLELYGPERKHLLASLCHESASTFSFVFSFSNSSIILGMRPFVTELDVHYFDTFLELSGITENAESSIASCSPASDSIYRYVYGGSLLV